MRDLIPLRFTTTYNITNQYFKMIKGLSKLTYVNAYADYGIKLGYTKGTASFGSYNFSLGIDNKNSNSLIEQDI